MRGADGRDGLEFHEQVAVADGMAQARGRLADHDAGRAGRHDEFVHDAEAQHDAEARSRDEHRARIRRLRVQAHFGRRQPHAAVDPLGQALDAHLRVHQRGSTKASRSCSDQIRGFLTVRCPIDW